MKNSFFSFLISMSFLSPLAVNAQVDLKSGLVAHYDFSGNTNDKSGNNLNGTTHGGVSLTTDRFNNANSAYDFDGEDGYIDVAFDNKLNLTGDKSISLWYYIGTGKVGANSTFLHMKNANSDFYPTFHLAQLEDKTYAPRQYQTSFFFGKSTSNYAVYTSQLFTNYEKQWVHIAATYSQSTGDMKMYFNGKLSDSLQIGNISSNSSNSSLLIGTIAGTKTFDNTTSFFRGSMDEVRIYNRGINESEVLALYNETDGNASVENFTKKKIELYPNPATNSFSVNVTQTSEVFIYDIKGALLNTKTISPNDNNIDISTYSNGIYMVKLIQGKEIGFAKLVK